MISLGIIKLLGEALGIVRSLTDPDKKDKSFHVALKKNWKKALDTAEDMMMLWDEHMHELPKKTRREYKKLKERFNDLD